jgi:hypothetical protein
MMNSVHLECGRDRVIFQKTSCYLFSGKCCAAEWYKSQGKVRSRLCDGISNRFAAGGTLCMGTEESDVKYTFPHVSFLYQQRKNNTEL